MLCLPHWCLVLASLLEGCEVQACFRAILWERLLLLRFGTRMRTGVATSSYPFKYLLLATLKETVGLVYLFIFLLLFCFIALGFRKTTHATEVLE